MSPAESFRQVNAAFTARVYGVADGRWDDPAPCEGWVARDVVRHLVEWFPAFLESGAGIRLAPGPSVDDDPAAAWDAFAAQVQALLDDPASAGRSYTGPPGTRVPPGKTVNVVATTPDLAAVAREIGGDLVTVTALAKPTEDPHFVDA